MIEGIEFVELAPGYYRMGSHYDCEKGDVLGRLGAMVGLSVGTPPRHLYSNCTTPWTEIPRPFWIARTEVTNLQFARFDAELERDGTLDLDRQPRAKVDWDDACRFCAWLSDRGSVAARLPTEAEWEYACRAGSETEYCFGDDEGRLPEFGWCGHAGDYDHPDLCIAGGLKANAWGLHDMHGGVAELCADVISDDMRAVRGGSWFTFPHECRSADRTGYAHTWLPMTNIGFRPVFTLPEDE